MEKGRGWKGSGEEKGMEGEGKGGEGCPLQFETLPVE